MANPVHLEILKKGVEAWNSWREENPGLRPDLSGAELSGVNVDWSNLERTCLTNADLSRANIRKANLVDANLQEANLSAAQLTNSTLCRATLAGADLREADLRKAYLVRADFHRANLSNADLRGAIFSEITGLSAPFVGGAFLKGIRITSESDQSMGSGGFLGLATARGLEDADFGEPEFLPDYLARAFTWVHDRAPRRKSLFIETAIWRITVIRRLYQDLAPARRLIEVANTVSAELIKYLKAHPKELYDVRPRQFEELIAEILASFGWEVRLTPTTRDGGYDIYAITKEIAGQTTPWLIECKKYAPEHRVGVDVVRALYGTRLLLRRDDTNLMLATTSHFTKGVHEFKASRYDLHLRDYEGVLEWINEYKPNPNGRLYIKEDRLIAASEE